MSLYAIWDRTVRNPFPITCKLLISGSVNDTLLLNGTEVQPNGSPSTARTINYSRSIAPGEEVKLILCNTVGKVASVDLLIEVAEFFTATKSATASCGEGTFGSQQTATATGESFISQADAEAVAYAAALELATAALLCDVAYTEFDCDGGSIPFTITNPFPINCFLVLRVDGLDDSLFRDGVDLASPPGGGIYYRSTIAAGASTVIQAFENQSGTMEPGSYTATAFIGYIPTAQNWTEPPNEENVTRNVTNPFGFPCRMTVIGTGSYLGVDNTEAAEGPDINYSVLLDPNQTVELAFVVEGDGGAYCNVDILLNPLAP